MRDRDSSEIEKGTLARKKGTNEKERGREGEIAEHWQDRKGTDRIKREFGERESGDGEMERDTG